MDKTSYALGMSIAHNMMQSGVKSVIFEDLAAGMKAVLTNTQPELPFEEAGAILDKYFAEIEKEQKERASQLAENFREEGKAWLKANAAKDGVKVTASGLQYKVLTKGSGKKPKASDKVRCHYEGKFIDGTPFDSSYQRNESAVFGLNQVIPGWTEGLQLMSEGAKYEFYIPYQLGYGENGAPGAIPPCATLIFTVELLEVL